MSLLFTGNQRIELSDTMSTNNFALDFLSENPPEGTLVIARAQSEGKGQKGTSWHSTPGKNLTFSLIFYPNFLAPKELFYLSKITALALYRVLSRRLPGAEPLIKWPNDLIVDRKKLAGILIENQLEGSRVKAAVIGIGLNVNESYFPFPLDKTAASMYQVGGDPFILEEVLEDVLGHLEPLYLDLRNGKRDRIDRDYLSALYGYQEMVKVEIKGEEKEMRLIGVEKSGRIAFEENQRIEYFDIKEIRFIL